MRTILIVDDDATILHKLERILTGQGYRVVTASNGLHAMMRIKAQTRPDLIITDLTMPGMNGYELVSNLRQMPECKDIPVIVITSCNIREKIADVAALGISNLILKP